MASPRDFLEHWGLVTNEEMNQRTAIIASDKVGRGGRRLGSPRAQRAEPVG